MYTSKMLSTLFFIVLFCTYNTMYVFAGNVQGLFIFGSSVVDNGNNNFNPNTVAKGNFTPYGIDFPFGPTGRFSNGKNIADILAEKLGLPLLPPFADPNTKGACIIRGVNYGSGGSGILDETGSFLNVTKLSEQIGNFERVTLGALEAQVGSQRGTILSKYVFMIAAGNNDYLLNYFIGKTITSPNDFAAKLVSSYSNHLKRLYNLGARKFVLVSVYPIGCSPIVSRGMGCLPLQNAAISTFHDQLITMVNALNSTLPDFDFVVVNSAKIIIDIVTNPGAAGFSNATGPCCQLSSYGAGCEKNGSVCNDRKTYVYFDGQHNTEALNVAFIAKAYTSCNTSDIYPINLQKFVDVHF